MPWGDGTGPIWSNGRKGAGYGRGFGRGRGMGYGRGYGYGYGRGFRGRDYFEAEDEKSWIKREIEILTDRLNFLKRRLNDIDE